MMHMKKLVTSIIVTSAPSPVHDRKLFDHAIHGILAVNLCQLSRILGKLVIYPASVRHDMGTEDVVILHDLLGVSDQPASPKEVH